MLVAFDRLNGLAILPGLVILCREILVSGLREFLADVKIHMPVSRLAKWKTTIQMTALGFLIVGDAGPKLLPTTLIGEIALWAAALLTIITGYDYLRAGLAHVTDSPQQTSNSQPTEGTR
jgi:phosphatidylglycerophosphate synthase